MALTSLPPSEISEDGGERGGVKKNSKISDCNRNLFFLPLPLPLPPPPTRRYSNEQFPIERRHFPIRLNTFSYRVFLIASLLLFILLLLLLLLLLLFPTTSSSTTKSAIKEEEEEEEEEKVRIWPILAVRFSELKMRGVGVGVGDSWKLEPPGVDISANPNGPSRVEMHHTVGIIWIIFASVALLKLAIRRRGRRRRRRRRRRWRGEMDNGHFCLLLLPLGNGWLLHVNSSQFQMNWIPCLLLLLLPHPLSHSAHRNGADNKSMKLNWRNIPNHFSRQSWIILPPAPLSNRSRRRRRR